MKTASVYEMHKGRWICSFERLRSAVEFAEEHAASVPDEAGMVVAWGYIDAAPRTIGDAQDLRRRGFYVRRFV